MKFIIDEPNMGKYSLNAFYAGMHYRKRKQIADYWHALTRQALRDAGLFAAASGLRLYGPQDPLRATIEAAIGD